MVRSDAPAGRVLAVRLIVASGRVLHSRRFGSKFFFLTIVENGEEVQVMVNLKKLEDTDQKAFKAVAFLIKRGDQICKPNSSHATQGLMADNAFVAAVSGRPARTNSNELALDAKSLPTISSPSIVPLPFQIPEDSRMQQRHLDLLLNRSARDILVTRQFIIAKLREYLARHLDCLEVQTPIIAANAGGATARPFATRATEFLDKELALRIAPELWLKRLVVAGFDRVFELGQAFRNEGVDATHNPEFTVCEFYMANANLDRLMHITQGMFYSIAKAVSHFAEDGKMKLEVPNPDLFGDSFEKVEFLPELEKAIGQPLPDLTQPNAVTKIINLLRKAGKDWHNSLPPNPSLPKLLDHMAAAVLEPRSHGRPLFIINHPVCMSPLAKSFTCKTTGQHVAARAELFFNGNELANMYEEENDPFKQRRKFVDQVKERLAQQGELTLADDEEPPHVVDEQYISVLESGLPPTAGWGCGVDRMVMLFTGAKRISDVQPFGNLRNVVGLASMGPQLKAHRSQEDQTTATIPADAKGTVKSTLPEAVENSVDLGFRVPISSNFEAMSIPSAQDDTLTRGAESKDKVAKRNVTKVIEDESLSTSSDSK